MARIYIVEDDPDIRSIERIALRSGGYETEEFTEGKALLERMAQHRPDMVLLDVMLPGMDGYAILQRIRSLPGDSMVPVIMVTARTMELDMIRGLDMGADDYIRKPFSVIELMTRVKAVLRRTTGERRSGATGLHLQLGEIALDEERRLVTCHGEKVTLTYKEYELLKLLLMNAGIVLRRDVILQKVWDTDFEGESRTVDMHIKTLRQKLGESGKRIQTVRGVGYRME